MTSPRRLCLPLIAAALLATPAGAAWCNDPPGDVDAFLEAWAKKLGEVRSLTLRFRQEKKLKILRRPKVSDGDLAFADGKLSVRVRGRGGEVESEILLRDGELKVFYPELKRLEVISLGPSGGKPTAPPSAPGVSIPFFAGDPRAVQKDYDVTLERGESGDLLTLVPRAKDSPVRRLELRMVRFELKEYRQVDANGDEVRMEVQSSEQNKDIPADRFELKVPEGTTVVRPAGK